MVKEHLQTSHLKEWCKNDSIAYDVSVIAYTATIDYCALS